MGSGSGRRSVVRTRTRIEITATTFNKTLSFMKFRKKNQI
jgi:hypothetical protein